MTAGKNGLLPLFGVTALQVPKAAAEPASTALAAASPGRLPHLGRSHRLPLPRPQLQRPLSLLTPARSSATAYTAVAVPDDALRPLQHCRLGRSKRTLPMLPAAAPYDAAVCASTAVALVQARHLSRSHRRPTLRSWYAHTPLLTCRHAVASASRPPSQTFAPPHATPTVTNRTDAENEKS